MADFFSSDLHRNIIEKCNVYLIVIFHMVFVNVSNIPSHAVDNINVIRLWVMHTSHKKT